MAIFHYGPPADFATRSATPQTVRRHRMLRPPLWVEVLGRRARALARALGQTRGNLSTTARRGAAQAARWQAEIPRWCR